MERDGVELFQQYSEQLGATPAYSEEHFGQLWDNLRRDLREVARSVYDEHWRHYRKANNLE